MSQGGNRAIETIFEGDIFHEVEFTNKAQEEINKKFAQFSQKYGIKKEEATTFESRKGTSDHS